ncbi:MAG: hypothetical protein IKG86_01765, partial [Paludibacteraceae bacterium]|nr:hypothetical protein [Paludibacteraceae bacterium]
LIAAHSISIGKESLAKGQRRIGGLGIRLRHQHGAGEQRAHQDHYKQKRRYPPKVSTAVKRCE